MNAIPLQTQIIAASAGLQLLLPIVLIAIAAGARPRNRLSWLAGALILTGYLLALGVVGQFGVPVPWFMPYIYGIVALIALRRSWRRCRQPHWQAGRGLGTRLWLSTRLALAVGLYAVAAFGLWGYRPHQAPIVELQFPLREGIYYVSGAGATQLINHHLVTLDDDFRRDYRGQSFGIDIIRVNAFGIAAPGFLPADPTAYAIFGEPVHAPCTGTVARRHDGLPDLPPPRRDLGRPLGNHVFIACKDIVVVLAHLQQGSVIVREGAQVASGEQLGRVGNSGQTTAPHLHIHAQRPGERYTPLRAEPVNIRFNGRYLVRNSIVWQ